MPEHNKEVKPARSVGDIRVGHNHSDGWWTVEFARKLKIGNAEDIVLDVSKTVSMGVSVFDADKFSTQSATNSPALSLARTITVGPVTLSFLR